MEIKIQAIHFDATGKLHEFIQKKVGKLEKISDNIRKVEVTLKVIKPETAKNKEVDMHAYVTNNDYHATKVCDTFEEGVDLCVSIIERQLEKYKEKLRGK